MVSLRTCCAIVAVATTAVVAKQFTAGVTEIDVIPLVPYEPYALPRMRWSDLNRALGMEASGKMLKTNPVDTVLGKIGVPKEDQAAFEKLSTLEVQSLFGDSEFEKERDIVVAFDMLAEGDVVGGIEMLTTIQSYIDRTRGKDHPLYANALADLGYAYMLQREFKASHEALLGAMKVDEGNQELFGVYNLAASINLMATSALRSGGGQFEALSAAYETAFDALHKIEHPAQFHIVMNLANMYRTHWLPLRALQMFKLAKQMKEHANFAGDVSLGLGLCYLMLGEPKQAQDILHTALDSYQQHRMEESLTALEATYQLATAEIKLGHHGRALRKLQTLRKAEYVEKNPVAQALVMASLGQCLLEMGYVGQSVGMLEAALARLRAADPVPPTNELAPFLPFVHIKLLHYVAKAWDAVDGNATAAAAHHSVAYERSRLVFGEDHAVTLAHQPKSVG
ncbi:hypothetical protein ACHHYP_09721 [Achlya hypogyna]|uniref:Secreted protein n=1 Tax=Achlya hypogyna TaxID=1202772 RepID=A0A0A7CMV8_ACHHY|nr:secreted protein [Achlya hypogyna]OQR86943.1 hypothetical protein ACHHYP_09721 [Achlya hypogyna]